MSNIITLTTSDGQTISFVDEIKASGGMKDIYFSPNKDYVVGFFRSLADNETKARLKDITGKYREKIFNPNAGGEYLKKLYCWPTAIVEWKGRLGVVSPFYSNHFFFQYGDMQDREKNGKWFASAKLRHRHLDERELGNWQTHLKLCIMLARAIRRMHFAGLSHSDLSYSNCLIDPLTGSACLVDIDGLVVPGKHAPTVEGTPDFVAPEVLTKQATPNRKTDLHALAVLIYMYLLYRHPLRGSKVFDPNDSERDEYLAMGEKALFIEHPTDKSNRINLKGVKPYELPWLDTNKIPYTITGPYLSKLFEQAFIDGLHNPDKRPSAEDWEIALVKTVDLLQPCTNAQCSQKWYPFDNKKYPKCPFCGTAHTGKLPVLNIYSATVGNKFKPDNHRIMVYSGQSLFKWHADKRIFPNEKISNEDAKRVGYFILHNGNWYLVNERLPDMLQIMPDGKKEIPIGDKVKLEDNVQIILQQGNGGRLLHIQMAG